MRRFAAVRHPAAISGEAVAARNGVDHDMNQPQSITRPSVKLTHHGALLALQAAIAKAESLGVPQNITIVDDGGNLLAFVRMDGAKLLSGETSRSKAVSAASHRQPTSRLDPALELKLALA